MTTIQQFWTNWWVQFAVALGTFGAVLVALFGDAFRGKFFPPLLTVGLASSTGERTKVTLRWLENGQPVQRMEDARYYHLQVLNSRRWSPAQQTQVVLLRVEEPDVTQLMVPVWVGDIPIVWRHQEVQPTARTVGPNACADLVSVVKGKWLQIHPMVAANNLPVVRSGPCDFVMSLQARSNEVDSAILRVRISWDGRWEDGAEEMMRHLKVQIEPDSAP